MEQKNPQYAQFQHSKEAQFIKIIALRKQCKKLQALGKPLGIKASLFSKIPLLLTKYEILPSLCYYANKYFTFDKQQLTILFYDFRVQSINTLVELESRDSYGAFLYQIDDYKIVISSGKIQQIQLAKAQLKKGQKPQMETIHVYQMKSSRKIHKVAMGDDCTLFFIGGNGDKVDNDCETLNLRNKNQSQTSYIPQTVRGEGACFDKEDLYLLGGFLTKEYKYSQLIQCYSPQKDL